MSAVTFSPAVLFATLDTERVRRDLSWTALEREIGVSAGTMKRLQTHEVFELDGILFVTQWLGRDIEDFTGELMSMPARRPRDLAGSTHPRCSRQSMTCAASEGSRGHSWPTMWGSSPARWSACASTGALR